MIISLKKHIFLSVCILFLLVSTIKSVEDIPYSTTSESYTVTSTAIHQELSINLSSEALNYEYTKISVVQLAEEKAKNFIISVFNDEGRTNRIQMDQSIFDNPKVWIRKTQLLNNRILATIECDAEPCNYQLDIVSQNAIELGQLEQMSYYVNQENRQTVFRFAQIPIPDSSSSSYFTMNIWAKGGNTLRTSLDTTEAREYSKKNFYVLQAKKEAYELTVTAEVGDFVNVGSLLFNSNLVYKELMVDKSEISIYLAKGYLEKACLVMNMTSVSAKSPYVFGTGTIDSNVARTYLEDIQSNLISGTTQLFNYGYINLILNSSEITSEYVCFDFPQEPEYSNIRDIVLTIQLTSGLTLNGGLNNFQPQQNGIMYPRYLLKGNKAAFIGHFPGQNFKEISYNMLSLTGLPKMTIVDCEDYPLCLKYATGSSFSPHSVNRFTSYSVYKNEMKGKYSPVNFTQTVLLVECEPSYEDANKFDELCIFGTLFYSELNPINLVENQYFNQYLLKGDKDKFKIDFLGQLKIKQIYVDINLFSGEVKTNIKEIRDGNTYQEYYNANKIYFIITLNPSSYSSEIYFEVTGLSNSFYSIQYSYVREGDDSNKKNSLESGSTYLLTVNPRKQHSDYESQKIVSFSKSKTFNFNSFLVNFFSLNCKLDISARRRNPNTNDDLYISLETNDYFTQDLYSLESDGDAFFADSYDYNLTVVEEDFSDYDNKRCMVYASAVEISPQKNEIIIGENTVQQILFKKSLKNITYVYPNADQDKDLLIVFNLIDKAKYTVNIYYENYNKKSDYTIIKNDNIKLLHEQLREKCPEKDEICNIIINIVLEKEIIETEPMLEIEVKTISRNSVTFLQKNNVKTSFITEGTVQYYYTEVGKGEEGSVSINFFRGEGKVAARLVKTIPENAESDANWRGLYSFPTASNSLEYDMYLKKIHYVTEKDECNNGCYLLITVYTDTESKFQLERIFSYSILVHAAPLERSYLQIPSMTIKTDYYVVGNVGHSFDEKMYEFYDIWINRDANAIEIDFQSDAAGIFINVGESKPTTKNADFKFFPSGKDSILTISKQDILQKGKDRGYSFPAPDKGIQNSILTIGIWANASDTVYTTVYSFLVHLSNNTQNDLDIHKVNADQKTLCIPKKTDDKDYPYRCLYVIENEEYNLFSELLIYATTQNSSSPYQIFANEINPQDYELNNINEIQKRIPNKNNYNYTTYNKQDYIYLSDGLHFNYLLVSVVAKDNSTIEFMSTFYGYDRKVTPNPSTPQLFVVKNDTLTLKVKGSDTFVFNLVSFEGEAEIYWDKEPNVKYYLRGRDDRLSLPSVLNSDLVIKDLNLNTTLNDTPSFAFYLTYNVRFVSNLDEFYLGKSVNFGYTNTQLPIKFYAKLPDLTKPINVFFTFYDIESESGSNSFNNSIRIRAGIVNVNTIYTMRQNDAIQVENLVSGIYDPGVKTGFLQLSLQNITNSRVKLDQLPYVYVQITGASGTYKRINIEITAAQENSLIPATEKVLQYGTVESNGLSIYKLRPNILKPNMRIQFASTAKNVNFTLSKKEGADKNDYDFKPLASNGKYVYDIVTNATENDYVYLNVRRSGTKDHRSDNYAFKYINYDSSNLLKNYYVDNSTIIVKKSINNSTNATQYELSFEPVPDSDKFNVTYIVKVMLAQSNFPTPEETIALTYGGFLMREYENPKIENNRINVTIEYSIPSRGFNPSGRGGNRLPNPSYIELYAIIRDKSVNEVLAYKTVTLSRGGVPTNPSSTSSFSVYNVIVTIVSVVLLIALVALILLVTGFKKKNQDLMHRVNQVSFQEEDRTDNAKGLLYSDEQNALS